LRQGSLLGIEERNPRCFLRRRDDWNAG